MKYPEDELYELVQAINPDAIINASTVYALRHTCRRLPAGSQHKYTIQIESHPGGPYYGPEDIRYDKYDMTTYSAAVPLELPRGKYKKTWELIPAIYDRYGFWVREEDIIQDSVRSDKGLRFTNQCILYEGTIRIVFDDDLDLEEAIIDADLNGFKQEVLDE